MNYFDINSDFTKVKVIFKNKEKESLLSPIAIEFIEFLNKSYTENNEQIKELINQTNELFVQEYFKSFDFSTDGSSKVFGFNYCKVLSKVLVDNKEHYYYLNNTMLHIIKIIYKQEIGDY